MRVGKRVFSPTSILLITWIFSLLAAYFGPQNRVYMTRDVIQVTFTTEGLIWIFAAILTFVSGCAFANNYPVRIRLSDRKFIPDYDYQAEYNFSHFFGLTYIAGFGAAVFCMLFIWTLAAIIHVGSFFEFLQMIETDWHSIRRIWPAQKPFPGARVVYTGLIAVMIYASSGLALEERNGREFSSRIMLKYILVFLTGFLPLLFVSLLVSQRFLLAASLFGSLVVYYMMSPRRVKISNVAYTLGTVFLVWTILEIIRTGRDWRSYALVEAVEYSLDRLLGYFSISVGNVNRLVTHSSERSYGFETFRFVFEILFIDRTVREEYLYLFYREGSETLAGGTFTGLGIPYADFGIFGLIILFIWGYFAQIFYNRSRSSALSAQIYALIAASVALSWHSLLWRSPPFWFNLTLMITVQILAHKKTNTYEE